MSKLFSDFVAVSRYCRWMPDQGRRESWDEAVQRYGDYLWSRFNLENIPSGMQHDFKEAIEMMHDRELFGSMRALMTAGNALNKDDVAAYNCCYIAVNRARDISNIMYVLMCGTGVGFSVEKEEVSNLPEVASEIHEAFEDVIIVDDSREGWANAYYTFLVNLYQGRKLYVDTGRASGPEPFVRLIKFTANLFHNARGRKLKPIEVHDLICQIAEIVICGGVRRSALISLSDLSDYEMAHAKSGPWWEKSGHRSLANNSAVYSDKPDMGTFMKEWASLYDSRSGERGICNRKAMSAIAAKAGRKTEGINFGTNPCSEIILRSNEFCNLSTVVVKEKDTPDTLMKKIRLATILGTLQSAMDNFKYFETIGETQFKENCQEERLLGVSMTGIFDNDYTNSSKGLPVLQKLLNNLKEESHKINEIWARILNINPSASITCVKPEGTTSCVAGSASGLHPRYDNYYIRRVRVDAKDPMSQFMKDAGIPWEACVMRPDNTVVFSFPISTNGVTNKQVNAIGHLNLWLAYQAWYCDHKPSVTVNYTDDDFLHIGGWLLKHWNMVSGVSFLPQEDHCYQQAPFESITEDKFRELNAAMPKKVDWSLLSQYELEDTTKTSHAMACTANGCELT
jgi:ribonucleoside-triphosphate reductase